MQRRRGNGRAGPPQAGARGHPQLRPTPRSLQWLALCLAVLICASIIGCAVLFGKASRGFSVARLAAREGHRHALPPPAPFRQLVGPSRPVWWHAPFFSGGGMGQEALQLVLGLQRFTAEYRDR